MTPSIFDKSAKIPRSDPSNLFSLLVVIPDHKTHLHANFYDFCSSRLSDIGSERCVSFYPGTLISEVLHYQILYVLIFKVHLYSNKVYHLMNLFW